MDENLPVILTMTNVQHKFSKVFDKHIENCFECKIRWELVNEEWNKVYSHIKEEMK